MLEKAIKLIEKEINMYKIQEKNITTKARKKDVENQVKEALRKEIALREFILNILIDTRKNPKKN